MINLASGGVSTPPFLRANKWGQTRFISFLGRPIPFDDACRLVKCSISSINLRLPKAQPLCVHSRICTKSLVLKFTLNNC